MRKSCRIYHPGASTFRALFSNQVFVSLNLNKISETKFSDHLPNYSVKRANKGLKQQYIIDWKFDAFSFFGSDY